MNLNFCVLSIIFAIVVLAINSCYAQSSDKFLTWTDDEFTIQHPSNWKAEDQGSDSVYFTIRENKEDNVEMQGVTIPSRSYFRVDVEKDESQLDYDTMTLQNKSLEQYVQGAIDVMPLNSETPIRQNEVTVAGNTGWKIEYTSNDNYKDRYLFVIYTIDNGKLYTLRYGEKPLKVPETLPLANKMVESFQIKK